MNLRKVQRVLVQGLRSFSTSLRNLGQIGATQPQETQSSKPRPAPTTQNVFMEPMQFQSSMLQETRKYSFGSQKSPQEEKKESLSMARAGAFIIRYLEEPQTYVPKGFYDDSFYDSYKTYKPNISLYRESSVQRVTDQVLSDVLIAELELKRQKLQLSQETIDYFKAMFSPRIGVPLPDYFKDQERIQDAFNSKFDSKDDQIVPQKQIKHKRFSFFPFRLMVKYVFPMVMRTHGKQMLVGSKGSSKTTNFIFFSFLSHIVTRHIVEYGKSDEWKDLSGIPMLFYLTCPNEIIENESQIIQRVLEQCPDKIIQEVPKEHLKSGKSGFIYPSIKRVFIKKYGIQTKVIVDQINRLAREVQSYNDGLKDGIPSENQSKIIPIQLRKKIRFWCFNPSLLGRLMFNSSQNIQDEILGNGPSVEYGVGLKLHTHTQTTKIQVHYEIESNVDWGRKQITKYLTSQVLKRVSSDVAAKILQSNDSFYSFLRNMQSALQNDLRTKVLTPLAIRKLFHAKKKDINSAPSVQELKQSIEKMTRELIESQLKQMRQKADHFIEDSKDNKKMQISKFLLNKKLFEFCANLSLKGQSECLSSDDEKAWNQGFINVRETDIGLNEIFEHKESDINLKETKVLKLIDKDYFEVSSQKQEQNINAQKTKNSQGQPEQIIISLKVHCDTYLKVLKNLPQKYEEFAMQNLEFFGEMFVDKRSALGSVYESAMINILKDDQKQTKQIKIIDDIFKIQRTCYFEHFYESQKKQENESQVQKDVSKKKNKKKKKKKSQVQRDGSQKKQEKKQTGQQKGIEKDWYKKIQAMITSTPQGETSLALPILKRDQENPIPDSEAKIAQNSRTIDFIIVFRPSKLNDKKEGTIFSVDTTINQSKQKISDKISRADTLLNKILNDAKYQNQEEIKEWIHIIYHPEMSYTQNQVCRSGSVGNKNYVIKLFGYKSVDVWSTNIQKVSRYKKLQSLLQLGQQK